MVVLIDSSNGGYGGTYGGTDSHNPTLLYQGTKEKCRKRKKIVCVNDTCSKKRREQ